MLELLLRDAHCLGAHTQAMATALVETHGRHMNARPGRPVNVYDMLT